MSTNPSTVTLHMVASLDGFIAKHDGDVAWLNTDDSYADGVDGEDPATYMERMRKSGCFVIGSHTYEFALKLGWCYADVPTYVLTHRDLPNERDTVAFHAGDLTEFVEHTLRPNYEHIWVCGGAQLITDFIRHNLADEICYSIAPVMIGLGRSFFDDIQRDQPLHLKSVIPRKSGVVELKYTFAEEPAVGPAVDTAEEP